MATALIVEEGAGKIAFPFGEDPHQPSLRNIEPDHVLERIDDTEPGKSRLDLHLDRVGDNGTGRRDRQCFATPLEFPWKRGSAQEPMTDAAMVQQIARMRWHATLAEIGGRSRGDETLPARSDRHGD